MIKYYLLTLSAIIGLALPSDPAYVAPEICDNGIDDDMDGLIDLNDTVDCFCNGLMDSIFLPASLIPNYSFEDTICCPSNLQQLNCAEKWIQASRATSDYYHTCDFQYNDLRGQPPQPLPSGNAYVGFLDTWWRDTIIWKEYIGACLDKPMGRNKNYRLQFYLGFGIRGEEYESRSPFTVVLYGTEDCVHLPFGDANYTNCPSDLPEWLEIGQVTVRGRNQWVRAILNFSLDRDINAVAIGPSCTDPRGKDYYFLDELVLNERVSFDDFQFDILGETCDSLIRLWTSETQNIDYQWFRNGVAIQGATDPELFITNRDDGVFILRASDGIDCQLSNEFHHFPVHHETHIDTSLCQGQQLVLFNRLYQGERQDTFYLSNRFGCDSTIFLDVRLRDTSYSLIDTAICEGQQIMVAGRSFSDAGQYRLTSTNTEGCDSFIYLTISLSDTFYIRRDTILCQGSGFDYQGQWIDSAGVYQFTIQSVEACDSLIQWTVGMADHDFIMRDSFVCSGQAINIGDTTVQSAGVYLRPYQNKWGCDSLVEWHIDELQIDTMVVDTLICWSDVIVWQGKSYDTEGQYQIQLPGKETCDTIAFLNVTEVEPFDIIAESTVNLDCHDDILAFYQVDIMPRGLYNITWEDGTRGTERQDLEAGVYHYMVEDPYGCMIEDSLVVSQPPPFLVEVVAINPDCNDEASGQISFSSISGGTAPYNTFINGNSSDYTIEKLTLGTYLMTIRDAKGCTYDTTVILNNIEKGEMHLTDVQDTFVVGDPIILNAIIKNIDSIVETQWRGSNNSCATCLSDTLFLGPGTYEISLKIIDSYGCEYYDLVRFVVIQQYWVPNAFTPNGDFINDFFNIHTDRSIETIDELLIFDRWGEMVYKGVNILPGRDAGWDGVFNGELMMPGVYVYLAHFTDKVGSNFQVAGDVTLIR